MVTTMVIATFMRIDVIVSLLASGAVASVVVIVGVEV